MSEIDIRDRRADRPSRGFGDVFGELSHELSRLVHRELQEAKDDLRAHAPTTGKASMLFAGTAVAGFVALLCVTIAAAIGLGEVIPIGFAFLAIGAAFAVAAFVLHRQRQAELAPPLKPVDGNDY